jgi:hypothetical protein
VATSDLVKNGDGPHARGALQALPSRDSLALRHNVPLIHSK